jgi:hypothetical protein
MRLVIAMLIVFVAAGMAGAQDLDSSRDTSTKPGPTVIYQNPVDNKQGGDTVDNPTVIPGLPYDNAGTTAGFSDDYDEVCPYTGSTAPDVVYSYTPGSDVSVMVDLCGSLYDTKLYVYDSGLALVACNDDFYFDEVCGTYVSALESLPLTGGETYFIIIDGYGGESGDYFLSVEGADPCVMAPCPVDAVDEGEPPLGDGYVDTWNSGCGDPELSFTEIDWINSDPTNPLDGYAWLCGRSGWYVGPESADYRDTDWFRVFADQDGLMEFTVEAEYPTYVFKLAPTDCATVGVEIQATADCEEPATLSFPVLGGEEIWLWIGPTAFTGPVTEYRYFATLSNNTFDVVPVEDMSFGGVKALFR